MTKNKEERKAIQDKNGKVLVLPASLADALVDMSNDIMKKKDKDG